MRQSSHVLSKSTFMRGLQCHKSLYLNRHHPDLRDSLDPATREVFRSGQDVGMLARELFPGGIDARAGSPFDTLRALARTQELIRGEAEVVYEAAFQHDGVLAYVDILARSGDGWKAFEVKSSTSVKDVHLPDVAIQGHLISSSGVGLDDLSLVHIDNTYVRQGELEPHALFAAKPVAEDVRQILPQLPARIQEFKAVLESGNVPDVAIGPHCTDPYECDFMGHCWAEVPEDSVFCLGGLSRKKKFAMFYDGIVRIEDIPSDFPLSDRVALMVASHRERKPVIDYHAIRSFLDSLEYPLLFLDFETINPAVPLFDNNRPYQQIPFQYSLHRKEKRSGPLTHTGFLVEAGVDPREEFLSGLLEDTQGHGSIVVYNQAFEATRLRELAELFPEHGSAIENRLDRMKDLMKPFRSREYYAPEMLGSYSIKNVLPALVPGLSYDGLPIADGLAAGHAFLRLFREGDPRVIDKTRKALWGYCEMDTLAMVRVLERLEGVGSS